MRFEILATSEHKDQLVSVMIDADSPEDALVRFQNNNQASHLTPRFVATRSRGPIQTWNPDRLTIQNVFFEVHEQQPIPVNRFRIDRFSAPATL